MSFSTSSFNVIKTSQNLATLDDVSIDLVVKGDYTYYLEVSMVLEEEKQRKVLQTLPIDPMDNTLGGIISQETVKALGSRTPAVLAFISTNLSEKIGAKKFAMIPAEVDMPEFVSPESVFERFKHGSRERVMAESTKVLQEHKDIVEELDRDYEFILDMNTILRGYQAKERFKELQELLMKARFTDTKMKEYSECVSRFVNENIRPMLMVNKNTNKISGIIRALILGEKFVYVSDEVAEQEIVALDRFPGANDDEKYKNRDKFLLAYLMHHACEQGLKDQNELLIIAAKGREDNYEKAGFQPYPLQVNGMKMVMKFDLKPGAELVKIKDAIGALELPADKLSPHIALSLLTNQAGIGRNVNSEEEVQLTRTLGEGRRIN